MKATIAMVFRILRNQLRNLARLMMGKPVNTPSLVSTTLGPDDVAIAKDFLNNRKDWHREDVISEYETKFAQWNGSGFAFSFMGGRVALSACLYALDLNKGDEVLLPGYTCVVVPNAIRYADLKPVFADIELDTYGLDAENLEKKITPRTKVVILHHLYGLVCRDYEKIIAIARKHKLKVIEDCAHSAGAEFKGRKVGTLGDLAFYSSEHSKAFNTIQGGMAVTDSSELASKLGEYYQQCNFPPDDLIYKQLSNVILDYHKFVDPFRWWKGEIAEFLHGKHRIISTTQEEVLGIQPEHYGQRMPAAIAAIGINQISKINDYNRQRRATAKMWDRWCDTRGYKKPVVVKDSTPVYLRYPVLVKEKEKKDLSWAVEELGLLPGVWFVSNVHPAQIHVEDCQNADEAVRRCINFPCLGVLNE